MEKKYVINCRYEHWTNEGKVWTKWFVHDSTPRTKEDAQNKISETKKNFGFIDQKTHLKHEYELKDYNEYLNEYKALVEHTKKLTQDAESYHKSDEYKELLKKKRQAAKERKIHQQKYLEEHGSN